MGINIKRGGCIPLVIIMSISDLMCWHIPCLQPHKTCNTFTWSSRNLPILFISLDLLAMLLVTSIRCSIQVSTRQAYLMHILCFYWCSQLEESANDFFGKFQWFLSCNLISNLFNLSLSLSLYIYIYIRWSVAIIVAMLLLSHLNCHIISQNIYFLNLNFFTILTI